MFYSLHLHDINFRHTNALQSPATAHTVIGLEPSRNVSDESGAYLSRISGVNSTLARASTPILAFVRGAMILCNSSLKRLCVSALHIPHGVSFQLQALNSHVYGNSTPTHLHSSQKSTSILFQKLSNLEHLGSLVGKNHFQSMLSRTAGTLQWSDRLNPPTGNAGH